LPVKSGLDRLSENVGVLRGASGVLAVTNHTAVTSKLTHLTEILHSKLGDAFRGAVSPEHGMYGQAREGEPTGDETDILTRKPVYSWYTDKPGFKEDWFQGVDTVVYDIQDGGVRYHTHLYVLRSTLEYCGAHGLRLIVLDRPNPIGGLTLEGNMPERTSIVCAWRIPIRYALTPGELALLMHSETGSKVELEVVQLEGWRREMWYDETGMVWLPLSPNTPTLTTSTLYPGTCLFEGTELSVGRGTTTPFEVVGAPWLDGVELARRFNSLGLSSVRCRPVIFTPRYSRYANQKCGGVHIHVLQRGEFDPILTALHLLNILVDVYGVERVFGDNWRHFDLLSGSESLRKMIIEGTQPESIVDTWRRDLELYRKRVEKHKLYL